MSLGDDTDREQLFMDWTAGVMREFKARGWTGERVAKAGNVSRNQLYQWRGRGKKGFSMPKPATVKAFCDGLGIPWEVPFRILGWDTSTKRRNELAPATDISERIRRIRLALDFEGLDVVEKHALEVELVRLQNIERVSQQAVESADEVLRRIEGGAA